MRQRMVQNGILKRITIDKKSANAAGIEEVNKMLKGYWYPVPIVMLMRKHLNSIVERDRRFIKRRTRPFLEFKSFA